MTHWREREDDSHRYTVNPWPLSIAVSLVLWALIFWAGYLVGQVWR
jgi:hypothetical protein